MSPLTLTAGLLHVGVTELLELLDEPFAMVALDLDDAVLHGAAGSAFLLERAAQVFECGPGQRHAVDRAHAFTPTMRGFLPDADGRWPVRCARLHALPSAMRDASAS